MHYLRNTKNYKILESQEKSDRLLNEKLGYSKVNNAIIVPHIGCFDSNKNFIDGTWLHETTTFPYKDSYCQNNFHIQKAVYMGCLVNIWGHCITDGIKRLWFLFSDYLKNIQNVSFVYTTVNEVPLPENYLKILKYIISNEIELVEIQQNTIVDELYIPDVSFYSTLDGKKIYFNEFSGTLKRLTNNYIKPQNFVSYDKIYLSRTALKSHFEFGEKYIEQVFQQAGFQIIHPEQYSLEEQLYLYENCNYFASLEGSGAHNSLFCKPDTKVFIIRKSNSINPYQLTIDKISKVNECYIDAHFSIMNSKSKPWTGPFFVYVTKNLALCLNNEFQTNIQSHFPIFLFIKYICISIFVKNKNLLRFVYHLIKTK